MLELQVNSWIKILHDTDELNLKCFFCFVFWELFHRTPQFGFAKKDAKVRRASFNLRVEKYKANKLIDAHLQI